MKLKRKESKMDQEDYLDDPQLDEPVGLNDGLGDSGLYNDNLYSDDFFGGGDQTTLKKQSDLLKELTNFSPYLREALNNWLGLNWDESTQKFVRNPGITPIMSLKGGVWCAGYLRTYARNNNIITHLDEDSYKFMMADHIEAIWINLGTRDDLGIKHDGDLLRVANEMQHAAELALLGASEGRYNKLLGSTSTYHYSNQGMPNPIMPQVQMPMQPQGGMVNKLKRMLVG